MELAINQEAERGLLTIAQYIIDQGYPKTSAQLVGRLYKKFDKLVLNPEMYPVDPLYEGTKNVRFFVYKQFRVSYEVREELITILRIVHVNAAPKGFGGG